MGMAWTYHPELLATPVPRYTSYPTAAEFGDGVTAADLGDALDAVPDGERISLYVHIPFCREICWYCGCNTGAANRSARLTSYLSHLEQEIALVSARLGGKARIGRIAFGGGSPNAITPDQFDALNEVLENAFDCSDATRSVEVDPRGFDSAFGTALNRNRVSRVSLGVQTLAPDLQARIGRVQPLAAIERTVELLRNAGIASINFDLMYGLPGQTERDLGETLDHSIAMGADRLAVFGYAHVPHMIPRQRRIDATALPDAPARFAQAAFAHAKLTGAGYAAVGFDHFAKPADALAIAARAGTLRRNFQGFTEDPADILIGFGASAIGSFPDRLLQNEKNNGRWAMNVGSGRFAVSRGVFRTAEDRRRGAAIESLLCTGQADLSGLVGLPAIAARLQPFERLGLLRWSGLTITASDDSAPYVRSMAAQIDQYRHVSQIRFSSAV